MYNTTFVLVHHNDLNPYLQESTKVRPSPFFDTGNKGRPIASRTGNRPVERLYPVVTIALQLDKHAPNCQIDSI